MNSQLEELSSLGKRLHETKELRKQWRWKELLGEAKRIFQELNNVQHDEKPPNNFDLSSFTYQLFCMKVTGYEEGEINEKDYTAKISTSIFVTFQFGVEGWVVADSNPYQAHWFYFRRTGMPYTPYETRRASENFATLEEAVYWCDINKDKGFVK